MEHKTEQAGRDDPRAWNDKQKGCKALSNDILEARWQQMGGQTRKWWGKLTDDDLERIGGSAERLADALQEKYGYTRQHAESQSNRWMHDHQDASAVEL